MSPRLLVPLTAAVVLGVFLAGLFVAGRLGGALLAVTVVALVAVSGPSWRALTPTARTLRSVVVVVVAALAVAKIVAG